MNQKAFCLTPTWPYHGPTSALYRAYQRGRRAVPGGILHRTEIQVDMRLRSTKGQLSWTGYDTNRAKNCWNTVTL